MITFLGDEYGPLKVFAPPEPDMVYSLGIDASTGLSDDYSCFQVLQNTLPFEQVAVFRAKMAIAKVTEFADRLGRWYNEALICCEINFPGNSVQDALLQYYQYPRSYKPEQHLDEDPSISPKYGFRTTETSKWMLIHELQTVIAERNLKINDKTTIYELSNYVYQGSSKKAGGAQGFNDDTVMALMMALHIARLYPFVLPTLSASRKRHDSQNADVQHDWKRFRQKLISRTQNKEIEIA